MNRKSFFRNLFGAVAAVTIGKNLKPFAIAVPAAISTVSSLHLGRFLLGDLIVGIDGITYCIVSVFTGSHTPYQYTARPLSMADNRGESIIIDESNHSQFTKIARQLVA